jgi:8-oxo-dGTP pyrophosphatase MutT (NUDIX family)
MPDMQLVGVVAGCVIEKNGKYLLVQEKQPKVYGLWNLPAGHVDKTETLQAAAIREVFEETGYIVDLGKEISVEHPKAAMPVLHAYEGKITGGKLQIPMDELLDAKWFDFDEVEKLSKTGKLRDKWVINCIKAVRQ